MEPLRLADLATVVAAGCGGGSADQLVGPDVVADSRQVRAGSLFVALAGEVADGHTYVAAAAQQGAAAALVSHPVAGTGLAQLVVPDPLAALASLARHVVATGVERGLGVIAVTGSTGKTSTKDLIEQVLTAAGQVVVAAQGSFNNDLGVPLTACRLNAATDYLVVELGARAPGDIARLTTIVFPQPNLPSSAGLALGATASSAAPLSAPALGPVGEASTQSHRGQASNTAITHSPANRPRIGLVLGIGRAHLGEFGSLAATAAAKGELIAALGPSDWPVLNADDPLVTAMAADRDRHPQISWFTQQAPALVRASDYYVWAEDVTGDDAERYGFTLVIHTPGAAAVDRATVRLQVVGVHQVGNALAAAAVAASAGITAAVIAAGLSQAQSRSKWRMEVTERSDGLLVVNDAYNANPDSMRAALQAAGGLLRSRRLTQPEARLIAVLGDMLELGEESAAFHSSIGALAAAVGVDQVIAVGRYATDLAEAARSGGAVAATVEDRSAAVSCLPELGPADIVLIKASRGVGLETVAQAVLQVSAGGQA